MSLILFFDVVEETSQMLQELDLYPAELVVSLNNKEFFNAEEK